jgi:hypothetical protein
MMWAKSSAAVYPRLDLRVYHTPDGIKHHFGQSCSFKDILHSIALFTIFDKSGHVVTSLRMCSTGRGSAGLIISGGIQKNYPKLFHVNRN